VNDASGAGGSDRRHHLLALKLQALVRDHRAATGFAAIAAGDLAVGSFALGAALMVGEQAWVLVEDAGEHGRGLGPAMVWAMRAGATSLDLVTDDVSGVIGRRAGAFALPINVWSADGRTLRPAPVATVESPAPPAADHLRFVVDIEAAGATPLVEHGVVVGEVRGLEVCRVVDADGADGTEARLDVGVGVHDREAFAIIHAGVAASDALATVVSSVVAVRDPSVPAHPLNRLAPERFLRWRLEQEPWLVGMASVRAAQPPVPRRNLKDRAACTARGQRIDGTEAVIVCSVGVDLDVIPYAADARLAAEGEPGVGAAMDGSIDVLVAMPPRDVVAVTSELAGRLHHSVTLVPVPTA